MISGLLIDVYLALVGLVVGSFLNVVIHRLPRRESIVLPASRCPACGQRIRALDNVPLVSYLILRGRCRACRAPISPRYPLVEAATAALFVASHRAFGVSWETAAALVLCCLLVALGTIDLEHYLLPDRLTLPGLVFGLAAQPWIGWTTFAGAVAGVVLGGGVLLAIASAWYLLRGEEGMGLGDVKMLAMIGAFLGWQGVIVTLFLASLTGAAVGLAVMGRSGAGGRTRLPFGTFLALGGLVALFFGRALVESYTGLL